MTRLASAPRKALYIALALLLLSPLSARAGQLAIIIDDIGYNLKAGQRTIALPGAYTLALLPATPHSQTLAELAHQNGKELMLHAPMANMGGLALGPGGLTPEQTRAEFTARLRHSLDSLPHIQGVNNHMGSALTPLATPMGWVMDEIGKRALYFVDSRTTAASRGYEVARAYGLKAAKRDVFLDHSRESDDITAQLKHAIDIAQKRGQAIAIGHPYPETLAALEAAQPLLKASGVRLVPASALAQKSAPGNGHCPIPPPLLRPVILAHSPVPQKLSGGKISTQVMNNANP